MVPKITELMQKTAQSTNKVGELEEKVD